MLFHKHFISGTHNSNMFQPLRSHFQGVKIMHSSSVGQQKETLVVKFKLPVVKFKLLFVKFKLPVVKFKFHL
jgi:hypothetical protein